MLEVMWSRSTVDIGPRPMAVDFLKRSVEKWAILQVTFTSGIWFLHFRFSFIVITLAKLSPGESHLGVDVKTSLVPRVKIPRT